MRLSPCRQKTLPKRLTTCAPPPKILPTTLRGTKHHAVPPTTSARIRRSKTRVIFSSTLRTFCGSFRLGIYSPSAPGFAGADSVGFEHRRVGDATCSDRSADQIVTGADE